MYVQEVYYAGIFFGCCIFAADYHGAVSGRHAEKNIGVLPLSLAKAITQILSFCPLFCFLPIICLPMPLAYLG